MVDAARREPGTDVYFVSRATKEHDTLFIFELFADRDAWKAHGQVVGQMSSIVAPFLASSAVTLGEPLDGKGLAP